MVRYHDIEDSLFDPKKKHRGGNEVYDRTNDDHHVRHLPDLLPSFPFLLDQTLLLFLIFRVFNLFDRLECR